MAGNYDSLSRARLTYEYLHTNSTTHEFLFGALAELIDNARDANSTKLEIFAVPNEAFRGGYFLCFLDDGCGMDPEEAGDVIMFGKSSKKTLDMNTIGQYGNGLKSGSMRVAKDFVLFTKKEEKLSCILLSRSFHEEEHIEEVIVPLPCWNTRTKQPVYVSGKTEATHALEMEIITKYTPFKTLDEIMDNFNCIRGKNGTMVILYNMKLMDNGEPELDITDPADIRMGHLSYDLSTAETVVIPEWESFRAYTAILYIEPAMKIYIQGKKVRTKRLSDSLYRTRMFKFSSTRFKTRSEHDSAKATHMFKIAAEKAREAESKARDLEKRLAQCTSADDRKMVRLAQSNAEGLRKQADFKKQLADRKQKALKDPKTLAFTYGFNIDNRRCDGMFLYNCGRLIKMYVKVGPQMDGGVKCSGVVGLVDIPYVVLEPTHNKQDFADNKEYKYLLRIMGDHLIEYWTDAQTVMKNGVLEFWESFGYINSDWKAPPSDEFKYNRKRSMQMPLSLQCDKCLLWRILPFSQGNIGKKFDDDWECSMNPDPQYNRCSSSEQKVSIVVLHYKKCQQKNEVIDKSSVTSDKLEVTSNSVSAPPPVSSVTSKRKASPSPRAPSPPPIKTKPPPRKSTPLVTKRRAVQDMKKIATIAKIRNVPAVAVRSQSRDTKRKEPPLSPPKPQPARKLTTPTKKAKVPEKRARTVASLRRKLAEEEASPSDSSESERDDSTPAPHTTRQHNNAKNSNTKDDKVKKRSTSNSNIDVSPIHSTKQSPEATAKSPTKPASDVSESTDESAKTTNDEIGTTVEAYMNNSWQPGRVVKVSMDGKRWKIKFDKFLKDRFDKWFEKSSQNLSIVSDKSFTSVPKKSPMENEVETMEVPTTTTRDNDRDLDSTVSQVTQDTLASSYKRCLTYFTPPSWPMDREKISNLPLNDLINFPLDTFFSQYEAGLRLLVIEQKKAEAASAIAKLNSFSSSVGELLKIINKGTLISEPLTDVNSIQSAVQRYIDQHS